MGVGVTRARMWLLLGAIVAIASSSALAADAPHAPRGKARGAQTPPTAPVVAPDPVAVSIFPPAAGGELLAYLRAGHLTPAQCLQLQRGGIAQYEAAIATALGKAELAGVVRDSNEILIAMRAAVAGCPPAPANPFNPGAG